MKLKATRAETFAIKSAGINEMKQNRNARINEVKRSKNNEAAPQSLRRAARQRRGACYASRAGLHFTLCLVLLLSIPVKSASAQDKPAPAQAGDSNAQKNGKEYLGPTADSIRPYRPYNRDPFRKPIKPKTPKAKQAELAKLLGFPPIDARR